MTRHADYYQRVKQDPEKLAALRARRTKNQKERRARLRGTTPDPMKALRDLLDDDPVVSKGSSGDFGDGGKHSATIPHGDMTLSPEQIMQAWKEAWQ